MNAEQGPLHKIAIRLFDEVVNQGHVDVIHDLYAPEFVDHAPGPGQESGPAGIIQVVERYRAAIPDLHVTLEDVLECGDRLVTRETWRGSQSQDLADLPANGAVFEVTRIHIFRIVAGRIVEEWTAGSVLDALRAANNR